MHKKLPDTTRGLSMRRVGLLLTILCIFLPVSAFSGDYMVEVFEEHYREKMIPGTGDMKVNHTWQARTRFGNKVLILLGSDYNLRKWLRWDLKRHKLWVAKIPDEGDNRFRYNMAVYMDLQQLQPVRTGSWQCDDCRSGPPPVKPLPKPVPE